MSKGGRIHGNRRLDGVGSTQQSMQMSNDNVVHLKFIQCY